MRPISLAAIASLALSATATAQATAAQPAQQPPKSELTGRRAEDHVTINGALLTVRPSADGFSELTLTATSARLFAVLPNAFEDVGLTLKEFDDRLQQAGTGAFRAQFRLGKQRLSTFLDCGLDPMGLPKADSYAMSMRVTTQIVRESDDRSTVRTLVQATGRSASNNGLTIHCPSTTKLEQRLADAIATRASEPVR